MKQVTKIVQKEITIDICEICRSEDVCIKWDWYSNCDSGCCEDWGEFHFCSFECFLKFAQNTTEYMDIEITLGLEKSNPWKHQSFTLTARGRGVSDVTEFLKMFSNKYFDKEKLS
jgi:hypothetical protein